jgi:hypothetical protein
MTKAKNIAVDVQETIDEEQQNEVNELYDDEKIIDNKLTRTMLKQREFWDGLIQYDKEHKQNLPTQTSKPQQWYSIYVGDGRAHISLIVRFSKNEIACEFYIPDNKKLFTSLKSFKDNINSELPYRLDWQPLEKNKASKIITTNSFKSNDEESWQKAFEWLLKASDNFSNVFGKYLKKV